MSTMFSPNALVAPASRKRTRDVTEYHSDTEERWAKSARTDTRVAPTVPGNTSVTVSVDTQQPIVVSVTVTSPQPSNSNPIVAVQPTPATPATSTHEVPVQQIVQTPVSETAQQAVTESETAASHTDARQKRRKTKSRKSSKKQPEGDEPAAEAEQPKETDEESKIREYNDSVAKSNNYKIPTKRDVVKVSAVELYAMILTYKQIDSVKSAFTRFKDDSLLLPMSSTCREKTAEHFDKMLGVIGAIQGRCTRFLNEYDSCSLTQDAVHKVIGTMCRQVRQITIDAKFIYTFLTLKFMRMTHNNTGATGPILRPDEVMGDKLDEFLDNIHRGVGKIDSLYALLTFEEAPVNEEYADTLKHLREEYVCDGEDSYEEDCNSAMEIINAEVEGVEE